MSLLLVLVLLGVATAGCISGSLKTEDRHVHVCVNGRWTSRGPMLRPRTAVPVKALISNRCEHNADNRVSISGFRCDAAHDMNVLDCLNTGKRYKCYQNAWHDYPKGTY